MNAVRKFDSDRSSPSAGREFVAAATAGLSSGVREQIGLMVSELATNSLVHAASGFEIRIDRTDTQIRIEVTDVGTGHPTLRSPATTEPHGRGLQIVRALSDSWGTIEGPDQVGKTVWFELKLPPSKRGDTAVGGRLSRRTGNPPGPARRWDSDRSDSPSNSTMVHWLCLRSGSGMPLAFTSPGRSIGGSGSPT